MDKNSKLKKLARTLLATTCLTVAAGSAPAAVITEATFAPGGDFSNNLNSPTVLTGGTDTILGTIGTSPDFNDIFELLGLVAGGSYHITLASSSSFTPFLNFYDSSFNFLPGSLSPGQSVDFVAPADGNLVFNLGSEGVSNYTVTLTPNFVPEPATFGLVGAALAGALALRRKKN